MGNRAPEIVVVGSANLDLVVQVPRVPLVGETVLGGDLARITGGKGANQAVAASRLGARVAMVGRVGSDEGGAMLRRALANDRVDTTHLLTTPEVPNGIAMIAVANDGDNAIVVSPGANARLSVDDIAAASDLIASAKVTLIQLEVPLDAVCAAAHAANGLVVLNPAPAPASGPASGPAPKSPLPDELLSAVDVLVPNQSELAILAGYDCEVDERIAPELCEHLPVASVVVTLGARGALVVENGETTHIPAPEIEAVDATAAGDAFCGALASALVRGSTLGNGVAWAVRVGAATTLRPGAQPSLPTHFEVVELLAGATSSETSP